MQIHELTRDNARQTKKTRVGRGGKRGTYSGRGIKGQKARAGGRLRPQLRDIIKKIPKRRGYGKNRSRTVNDSRLAPITVSVAVLDAHFENGASVTPAMLKTTGVVSAKTAVSRRVKILANGEIKTKLAVSGCEVSEGARKKIEAAGGSVA